MERKSKRQNISKEKMSRIGGNKKEEGKKKEEKSKRKKEKRNKQEKKYRLNKIKKSKNN